MRLKCFFLNGALTIFFQFPLQPAACPFMLLDMSIKPFLKWVGGKRQLLPEIQSYVPSQAFRYVEPFMGGAAVFFHLMPEKALLNDINTELVNCFNVVKQFPHNLIEDLKKHVYNIEYYNRIRSLDRKEGGLLSLGEVARASRFIYLNRTGFNGLYRVNSKGFFNVPIGRYKNPRIFDEQALLACSNCLQSADITNRSFEDVLASTEPGDFVYLDPPYIPLSKTSSFTRYANEGFNTADQVRLAQAVRDLDSRGISFLASNSYTESVFELYQGFHIAEVSATRAINSKSDERQAVKEVLITNCNN